MCGEPKFGTKALLKPFAHGIANRTDGPPVRNRFRLAPREELRQYSGGVRR